MISRTKYLKIKKGIRTLRYIATSLLLVELVVVSGIVIAASMCGLI